MASQTHILNTCVPENILFDTQPHKQCQICSLENLLLPTELRTGPKCYLALWEPISVSTTDCHNHIQLSHTDKVSASYAPSSGLGAKETRKEEKAPALMVRVRWADNGCWLISVARTLREQKHGCFGSIMKRHLPQPELWDWGTIRKYAMENRQPQLNGEDWIAFWQVMKGEREGG